MLDGVDVRAYAREAADYVHLAVEATKLAFGDRDRWLADPEHAPVPLARLLDPAYLRDRGGRIAMDRAARVPVASGIERGDTIACITVDAAGNCVSLIQSIYHEWGSGVVAGETGVVLQNRGAGFTLDPAHPNALAPGKRPFHTLTPFMYLRDGRPLLVAGTMGGEGQPQTLVAVATRVVDLGLDVQSAVEAPRWVYGRTWGRRRARWGSRAASARRWPQTSRAAATTFGCSLPGATRLATPKPRSSSRTGSSSVAATHAPMGRRWGASVPTHDTRHQVDGRPRMSHPVRATLEEARVAPIPPGSRSSLLMQHGSMKLRYYAPRSSDPQTPYDQTRW
jgi:hypothetical protein